MANVLHWGEVKMRLIKRPLFTALLALGVAFTAAAQQPPVDVPPADATSPATSAAPPR